jgi:hypothetical protein
METDFKRARALGDYSRTPDRVAVLLTSREASDAVRRRLVSAVGPSFTYDRSFPALPAL